MSKLFRLLTINFIHLGSSRIWTSYLLMQSYKVVALKAGQALDSPGELLQKQMPEPIPAILRHLGGQVPGICPFMFYM